VIVYWLEQALTGGAPPPRELATPSDVVERVRERPGAVGYVPRSELPEPGAAGVRVLPLRVGSQDLLPGEDGYPIAE
jgi:hypothetical protein